ncbi:MAG: YihY/virulence factor BrkB family protein, partial [Ignavibacteria bacterium]|nr:YihY/virulence factor BrkB family protein [Ignavibacteria bacterium]
MSLIRFYKNIRSFIELKTVKYIVGFIRHYIFGLAKRIDEHNLFFAASGISFSLLIGMIPFILLVFFLFGALVDQETIQGQVINLIEQVIPYPAYADYVKKIILSRLPEVRNYSNIAGLIGVFGLMITASWIFTSLRTILNQIFHTKIQKGFIYVFFRDIVMTALLLLIILFFTFLIPTLNVLSYVTNTVRLLKIYELDSLINILVYFSSLLIMFFLFYLLYYFIPYEPLGRTVPAISAVWTMVLWEVARSIFGYYVYNFLGTNPFYGAFVLMVAVLLWIFYSSVLLILGAEIGQLFRERR